jgi:hypothetical protein
MKFGTFGESLGLRFVLELATWRGKVAANHELDDEAQSPGRTGPSPLAGAAGGLGRREIGVTLRPQPLSFKSDSPLTVIQSITEL